MFGLSGDTTPAGPTLRDRLGRLRRRVLRHRRGIAAALAAMAVYLAVQAATAEPPAPVPTWVAARDLPSGTVLATDDLTEVGFARGSVPDAVIDDPAAVVGRTLAAPVHQGVPITDDSVVGDGWLEDRAGLAAVPVRVTDPVVAGLLSVGDSVELVAADPGAPDHVDVLTEDAVVLAVPAPATTVDGALTGRLVVFGIRKMDAPHIAAQATARYLSVVWDH